MAYFHMSLIGLERSWGMVRGGTGPPSEQLLGKIKENPAPEFWNIVGSPGPWESRERLRFDKQCRLHSKSVVQTHSEARSWAHCL